MKDVEGLRKAIQQVANFILKHMMETAEIRAC
ncbi:phage integrase [Legionella sainthelensi]|nr:phage integrase [Legionella sainthelensi]